MTLFPAQGVNSPHIDILEVIRSAPIPNKRALRPYRQSKFESLPRELRDMIYAYLGFPIARRISYIEGKDTWVGGEQTTVTTEIKTRTTGLSFGNDWHTNRQCCSGFRVDCENPKVY